MFFVQYPEKEMIQCNNNNNEPNSYMKKQCLSNSFKKFYLSLAAHSAHSVGRKVIVTDLYFSAQL